MRNLLETYLALGAGDMGVHVCEELSRCTLHTSTFPSICKVYATERCVSSSQSEKQPKPRHNVLEPSGPALKTWLYFLAVQP